MDIGKKIALCRKEAHMSQEALAAELGISRQAVSRWETGEAVPDTEKVLQLARLFSVSTDYLLMDEIDETRTKEEQQAEKKETIRRAKERSIFRIVLGVVLILIGLSTFRWMFILEPAPVFVVVVIFVFTGSYFLIAEYMDRK